MQVRNVCRSKMAGNSLICATNMRVITDNGFNPQLPLHQIKPHLFGQKIKRYDTKIQKKAS
jgi:hypothetical protein